MKLYKATMLIAAAVISILMAWCGVVAAVTTPVLMIYAVEQHSAVGVLMLAVLVLSGLIAARLSCRIPSPFPQLFISAALGAGYTVIAAWMDSLAVDQLALDGLIRRAFQITGLVFPAVASASAVFSLPAFFSKNIRRKNHAILNLGTLLALIVTADSVMTLLDLPVLTWQQIAQPLSILTISRYRSMLLAIMQTYTGIPLLLRLGVGAFFLLVLGRAQYVAGRRKLHRRTATAVPIRPAAPPSARPIAPLPRPVVSAASRSQPSSTGINVQDSAMLDALAAQTISGHPIGLNTATGVPNVSGVRR